jgi:hypothetical protein
MLRRMRLRSIRKMDRGSSRAYVWPSVWQAPAALRQTIAALKERPFKADRTLPSALVEVMTEQGCAMPDDRNGA